MSYNADGLPIKLSDVIGQDRVITMLRRTLRAARLGRVLLFDGPRQSGRRSLGHALAASLLCQNPNVDENALHDACGECPSCLALLSSSHPDMGGLPGRASMDKVNKEALEEFILEPAQLSSFYGGARIFLLPDYGRIDVVQSNRLLKLLEEPPEKTYFFLTKELGDPVLKTILSRSQLIRLSPLNSDHHQEIAHKHGWTSRQLEKALGNPLGLSGVHIRMDELLSVLRSQPEEFNAIIQEIMDQVPAKSTLSHLTDAAFKRLVVRESLIRIREQLRSALKDDPSIYTVENIQAIQSVLRDLDRNLQPRLALERLTLLTQL